MAKPNRGRWALTGAAIVGARASLAICAEPTTQELLARIHELQARLDRLEATGRQLDRQGQPAVAAVLDDARRRSQFLDAGQVLTGGWNAKKQQFFLGSADGNFYLHPGVIYQFRGVGNSRDDAKNDASDDVQSGFEVRRAKFYVEGNVLTRDLAYRFQWQTVNDGGLSLQLGWAQYRLLADVPGVPGGELLVQAGQFRNVVFKEEIAGDTAQLMVERSIANRFVGGVPVGPEMQGADILLAGENNPLHAELVLHKGANGINTVFTNNRGANPAADDFGIAARVDYKAFGDWIDTVDLTGRNTGRHDLLDIGAGVDFNQAPSSSVVRWTVDAQAEVAHRLAVVAALQGNHVNFRGAAGPDGRDDYGLMIEGGYSLSGSWQAVARYAAVRFGGGFEVGGRRTFQEVGVGLNHYLGDDGAAGNRAKVSFDLNWLPDGVPGGAAGLDFLPSPRGRSELVFRTQLQLFL